MNAPTPPAAPSLSKFLEAVYLVSGDAEVTIRRRVSFLTDTTQRRLYVLSIAGVWPTPRAFECESIGDAVRTASEELAQREEAEAAGLEGKARRRREQATEVTRLVRPA